MAARVQLQKMLSAQKLENLKSEISQKITFPTIWSTGDFFNVLLKFKMAAMHELHSFLWAQKLKNRSQKNNVQVILLKFKMATTSQLFEYL